MNINTTNLRTEIESAKAEGFRCYVLPPDTILALLDMIDRPAASGDVQEPFVPAGYANENDFLRQQLKDARTAIEAYKAASAERAPVADVSELARENVELQKALTFWMPQVNQFMSDEMSQRIAHDAYMLVIDGNLPDDFKTAQELGWIFPATGKAHEGAKMICGNCMEPIPATVLDTSAIRAPVVGLTHEQIKAAGGIVHKDGNIFFTNIDKLNECLAAANGEQK